MTSDSDNKGKVDSENWRQPTPAAASGGEQRTAFQESNLGKCAGNRIRLTGWRKKKSASVCRATRWRG